MLNTHIYRGVRKIKYNVELPQHINIFLFMSGFLFLLISFYFIYQFIPYVNEVFNDFSVLNDRAILVPFILIFIFILQAVLIMMTNSFAMPLGLILGVSTVASYFLDMSGGYFSLVFNLIVPLLALSFLVLGNKGLTKEINYLG